MRLGCVPGWRSSVRVSMPSAAVAGNLLDIDVFGHTKRPKKVRRSVFPLTDSAPTSNVTSTWSGL